HLKRPLSENRWRRGPLDRTINHKEGPPAAMPQQRKVSSPCRRLGLVPTCLQTLKSGHSFP
ncbi:hypothetical protein ATANTOWER_025514, partial [Ataeniobius toweri]|nr:hypothetical protein [Ataeniobius toweri]